jgi:chaperonin GroES
MTRKLSPMNDIVILQRKEKDEVTPGGILMPGSAAEDSNFGTVVATGPGKMLDTGVRHPTGVEIGQSVMFDREYARDVKVDGEELTIIAAENILAIAE